DSGSRTWEKNANYRRAVMFLGDGFADWGARELDTAFGTLKKNPAALLAAGKLCSEHALTWQSLRTFDALRLALSTGRSALPKETFDAFLYPVPMPATMLEQCARYGFAPQIAYAIIREESRFDASAISAAGAMGLMQIMPKTGESIAAEMGFPMQTAALLLRPETNIAFGMRYASSLLKECGGSYHMMLAAYNAGMGNAQRWFDKTADTLTIQEQVDAIDYRETRAYVQRIVESSHVYASFFSGETNP
ncbi:MAG: lytic transglycosylase domain-containing protein, partial [Chitinivibrionia bacterium]|nr:lytic transglycosylase domain-containing protein [Chitinivibrionia bacterium]